MDCLFCLIATLFISCFVGTTATKQYENQWCQSRPSVVFNHENTYPYFVSLHRCAGSCGLASPLVRKCVADVENDVRVSTYGGSILMKNHTKCKAACATKASDCPSPNVFKDCLCTCPHRSPPAGVTCAKGKSWDMFSCKCVCDKTKTCPSRRYFDESTCGCKCKQERKTRCEKEGGIFKGENCGCKRRKGQAYKTEKGLLDDNLPFWICMILAEFIILTLIFEAFLFYKNQGLVYKITQVCHTKCLQGRVSKQRGVKNHLGKTNSIGSDDMVDIDRIDFVYT